MRVSRILCPLSRGHHPPAQTLPAPAWCRVSMCFLFGTLRYICTPCVCVCAHAPLAASHLKTDKHRRTPICSLIKRPDCPDFALTTKYEQLSLRQQVQHARCFQLVKIIPHRQQNNWKGHMKDTVYWRMKGPWFVTFSVPLLCCLHLVEDHLPLRPLVHLPSPTCGWVTFRIPSEFVTASEDESMCERRHRVGLFLLGHGVGCMTTQLVLSLPL